jgi:hypothetical protein
MKNSPIHGWTWPMFIIIINLGIIDQLFTTAIFSDSNLFYFIINNTFSCNFRWLAYPVLMIWVLSNNTYPRWN